MTTRIAVVLAVAGIAALPALAGPTAPQRAEPGSTQPIGPSIELDSALSSLRTQLGAEYAGGSGGFTDDPLPIFPAAYQTSVQSLSLRMFGSGGASGFVNSLGEVNVLMNSGFQSLGTNPAGKQVVGQIRQFFDPNNRNFIEAEFKTSDGSALVPVGTTVGGQVAIAYGWEVGATDPIDWLTYWTHVNVPAGGAIVSLFGPGGNSNLNHTPELVGPNGGQWNGSDSNNPAITLGDLFNRVLIRYEVQPVPAPAGLGALAMGVGLAARRRRR